MDAASTVSGGAHAVRRSSSGVSRFSIGIASYPQHTQSDSLLRAADAALYRAKELGRSRIVSFGRLKTS